MADEDQGKSTGGRGGRRRQTVAGSVEEGQRSRAEEERLTDAAQRKVDDEVRGALPYIRALVPPHMNPNQYIAIVIGLLHRDERLALAASTNMPAFLAALADCARLGLIPGDTYAFLSFWDQKRKRYDITGDRTYTGELELIYNTGLVRTVMAEVVFAQDEFAWGELPHDPPHHKRTRGRFPTEKERGGGTPHSAEGAFCYAVFMDGSTSRPVGMSVDEIMLHRDAARSKEGWDGPFWKSFWLKTVVHELYKWLQKSPELRQHRASAAAAMSSGPLSELPAPSLPVNLGAGAGNGGLVGGQAREIANGGTATAVADPPAAGSPASAETLTELFERLGMPPGEERVAVVVAVLGADTPSIRRGELNPVETERVHDALSALADMDAEERAEALARLTGTGGT